MESRSAAEARAQLAETLDELAAMQKPIAITRRGKPAAVLMPLERYEALTARKAQSSGFLSRLSAWRQEFCAVDDWPDVPRDDSPGREVEWPR